MFRCQMCGKVSPAGTKGIRVAVAFREKVYKGNLDEFPQRRFGRFRQPSKPKDRGGKGFEIVRELLVCAECAESHQQKQVEAQEAAKAAAERRAAAEAAEAAAAVEVTAGAEAE